MRKFVKDPEAELDYTWDWSDFLVAGEEIIAHTVTTEVESLVVDSSTADAITVTAWLVAGADHARGLVTCHVETNQGRADDRSIYVQVRHQ